MKYKLLSVALLVITSFSFAQQKGSFWKTTAKSDITVAQSSLKLPQKNLLDLDVNALKAALSNSPQRSATSRTSNVILSLPNADGQMESFKVFENSNLDPALAARYPEIKSYIGYGVDNPTLTAYFSVSPLGFKSMVLGADRSAVFIEPYSQDMTTYSVYRKSDKAASFDHFECAVIDAVSPQVNSAVLRPNADDAVLRTFRLAMSCTGEYAVYFGGTKALALAAINNTMTRVNGVFEKDFGARMVLIANTDLVIYTNASTDPYAASSSMSQWNSQLQSTLTSVIGEANYDIGHLFGATGGGGNAGCIGCICTNGSKGSGITSPADGIPSGDNFDIDYVAHEMGHQFGANHTFTHSNEGTGVQMEPGSGSTIMGYAGITTLDVQPHSDAYFHAVSIQQVTNNIKTKTCSVNTATGNSIPTASAGLDYTIPKSTPFMLTATGTDADGDVLTYNWEQMDSQTTSAAPSATKTTGVNFRSYNSATTPTRYFPRMASVLTGATTTAGTELTVEALSSVARTMNFRVTVRDNRAGGPANNSDDMIVTVNATAGPFSVTAPNTAVSYAGGSSQTITWAVAGTTANGVNCANVDVLLSTDAGATWTTLLAATPNDGTEAVTIPNTPGTTNRIMVKGTNHIFFDVSNTNFTITAGSTDTVAPTAPTLAASGTTQTTTSLSWSGATDNVAVTGYDVYKDGVLLGSTASTTYAVSGLSASTTYAFTVKAKDAAGNASVASNTASVTTLAPVPDTTAPTAPTLAASGTTQTSTNLSWSGATDNVGVTGYDVYKDGVLLGLTTTTSYAVSGLTATTTYAFTVNAKDAAGNVSVASNTVSVTTLTPDTTAPTAPTLSASGTTSTTTNLSWSGATDNVGVTGYNVYRGTTLLGSTTTTTYAVTGLTASTAYTFYVQAKDAAGNVSVASNTVSVTTLANTITYCTSTSSITTDEKIGKVVFGTISNTSTGTAGYENFTALSTNVVRGTAYTITITPSWTSTVYKEGYAVWIDYNGNGVFTDAGEKVWTKAASTTTPVTGTFTIPATATLGATRMRVQMNYNATPTSSCQAFTYGQVEDYTVNISLTARMDETASNNVVSFNLFPNPVNGDVLNVSNLEKASEYVIFNMMGQELGKGRIENEGTINVGSLTAGTYLIQVTNENGSTAKRFIKQ
jgi:chitodextrinase